MDPNDDDDDEAVPVGPFTDFGQWGKGRIDLRVFLQDEFWVDSQGAGHTLTSMSDEHRGAVVRVLLINAEQLHIKILYLLVKEIRKVTLARDAEAFGVLLETAVPLMHLTDPYQFMETTVLMKRLRTLTPGAAVLGDLLLEELQRVDGV
jgi:hypothetical protein